MKDIIFDTFQNDVSTSLIRHKSILDVLTKYTESCSKVNRSVAKAVTNCGCIDITASNCREVIENQIGTSLFYLVSLCNILDINLYDVLINETSKLDTLGKFTFR